MHSLVQYFALAACKLCEVLFFLRLSLLPLQTFSVVFHKAIERVEESDDVKQRILNLIDSITYSVFVYTTRGLFERDKLTFTSQVTFQVQR